MGKKVQKASRSCDQDISSRGAGRKLLDVRVDAVIRWIRGFRVNNLCKSTSSRQHDGLRSTNSMSYCERVMMR